VSARKRAVPSSENEQANERCQAAKEAYFKKAYIIVDQRGLVHRELSRQMSPTVKEAYLKGACYFLKRDLFHQTKGRQMSPTKQ